MVVEVIYVARECIVTLFSGQFLTLWAVLKFGVCLGTAAQMPTVQTFHGIIKLPFRNQEKEFHL